MPNFLFEDKFSTSRNAIVVGIDEVGYGAIAGPVVAAVAYIPDRRQDYIDRVKDSKALSKRNRESLFLEISKHVKYGIGFASVEEIEEHNVLVASHIAMKRALLDLKIQPDLVLVDGIRTPEVQFPCMAIVKGDSLSTSIATASIIAKVTRDQFMLKLHNQYPDYSWNRNCGYATKEHILSIRKYGTTTHHRSTFAPVKLLTDNSRTNLNNT